MLLTVDELFAKDGVTLERGKVYYRCVDGDTSKRSASGSFSLPHASHKDRAARKKKAVSSIRRMRFTDYSQPGFWVNFSSYA